MEKGELLLLLVEIEALINDFAPQVAHAGDHQAGTKKAVL